MSSQIILNSSHIVEGTNNSVLRYNFNGDFNCDSDTEIALSSVQMYNSIFNIDSQAYNNNKIQYFWLNSLGNLDKSKSYTITIPNGIYNTQSIYESILSQFIANGHYLINKSDPTKLLHFFNLVDIPTLYKCKITVYRFLTKSSVDPLSQSYAYNYPSGTTWKLPNDGTNTYFQLWFPSTSNLHKFLGFGNSSDTNNYIPTNTQLATGSFTSKTSADFLSISIPEQEPVSSILVQCNLVKNRLSYPENILHSFTLQSDAGKMNNEAPNNLVWMKCNPSTYQYCQITFIDQLQRAIKIQDPQMLVSLVVRQK